jgi:hypothetical protein
MKLSAPWGAPAGFPSLRVIGLGVVTSLLCCSIHRSTKGTVVLRQKVLATSTREKGLRKWMTTFR